MNPDDPAISPAAPLPPEEDPVLTAYALGALSPQEAAAVEARLEHDGAAREFVAQMRELSGAVAQEMAEEAESEEGGLSPAQRRALRKLIAKRTLSGMKFPRVAVICAVVAILLALFMTMLWVAVKRH